MKRGIMILLLLLAVFAEARPHRYRHRTPRPLHCSWQQITAGGAAAGTIIAAYKISNGVEDGLKTAAEKKPEAFTGTLTAGHCLWKFLLLGLALVFGYKFWRKHFQQLQPSSVPKT